MEYLQTTIVKRPENGDIEINIFEVDTDSFFAQPKNTTEIPEFYFGKIGRYWSSEPYVQALYLQCVVEALGLVFTNRFPVPPGEQANNWVTYHEPRKTT